MTGNVQHSPRLPSAGAFSAPRQDIAVAPTSAALALYVPFAGHRLATLCGLVAAER